jgi:hypothetical protein
MGDKQKLKIESLLNNVEGRLFSLADLTHVDRSREYTSLKSLLRSLETDIQRFQINEYTSFPKECDKFERKHSELSDALAKANPIGDSELGRGPVTDQDFNMMGPVFEANNQLREGKVRALMMLHTINNMKEEVILIEDEVMIQRERMLSINDKLKESQSVLAQTRHLVSFFTKAVYDDVFIKALIALIVISILVVFVMAISIKIRKDNINNIKIELEKRAAEEDNYDDIDEVMFQSFITGKKKDPDTLKKQPDRLQGPIIDGSDQILPLESI